MSSSPLESGFNTRDWPVKTGKPEVIQLPSSVLVIRTQSQHSQLDLMLGRHLTYLRCQATIFTAPKNNDGE